MCCLNIKWLNGSEKESNLFLIRIFYLLQDILGNLCGFLVIIIGVILLNTFKDLDVSLNDVRGVWRPKRELIKGLPLTLHEEEADYRTRSTYGTPDSL